MAKLKVFISSVQKEFIRERQRLFNYLISDPLLGLFFEPFIFENLPASDRRVDTAYIMRFLNQIFILVCLALITVTKIQKVFHQLNESLTKQLNNLKPALFM